MSRSTFQGVDVVMNSSEVRREDDAPRPMTPQQNLERQDRLAKALRENLLKRKEQMRARLLKIEEALHQPQSQSEIAEV